MKKLPLGKAFMFIEPGPVTLITTFDGKKNNVMTLTWIMVKDWTPEFAILTGSWNYSYKALIKNGECVISVPGVDLAEKTVGIGSCSGEDTDKFKKFGLMPLKARSVSAPLIKECLANIECRVKEYIKKHDIFILEGVNAWVNEKRKEKKMFHAIGDGRFVADGREMNYREIMRSKIPPGV